MQVITTMRHHYIPTGMAKMEETALSGEDPEPPEMLFIASGCAKWDSCFEKLLGSLLHSLAHIFPYNPVILLLDIYQGKKCVYTQTCT